jgi:excisionase family DNA binding protein
MKKGIKEKELLEKPVSPQQAADFFGVPLSLIYRLCHLGKIRFYKFGGRYTRLYISELEEDMRRGTRKLTA